MRGGGFGAGPAQYGAGPAGGGSLLPGYLLLRLKRAARLLPPVLGLGLALCAALALLGYAAARSRGEREAKVQVGIVFSGGEDQYASLILYAQEHMDSSRLELSLIPVEDEDAARQWIRAGRLNAYVVIPAGFVQNLYEGRELVPIRFVSAESGTGTVLMTELARTAVRLMAEAENSVYGAQAYTADRLRGMNPYAVGNLLLERYFDLVLSRGDLFNVEVLGAGYGLGLYGWFVCALTVGFLMLWGVACGPLCTRRELELLRMLRASGLGAAGQVTAEYAAYMALLLAGYLLFGGVCLGLLRLVSGVFPSALAGTAAGTGQASSALLPSGQAALLPSEVSALLSPGQSAAFLLRGLPAAMALGAGQLLLYELFSGAAEGLLAQFLTAAGMAWFSGCLYPPGFFPDAVRRLGAVLPAGAALSYLGGGLGGEGGGLPLLVVYGAAFLGLLALCRRVRLEGRERQ